jgi:poly(hydroxyalkanoate) depolymerase family esterase
MARISETLTLLDTLRTGASGLPGAPATRLRAFRPAIANPGGLEAMIYIPDALPADAPLVVALHGCTQTASGYDHGTGWSRLAEQAGFAVLLPQQTRANNANLCFNWFAPEDVARRGGEVESIAEFTRAAIAAHRIDPARVFISGLSAGGAMTAAMLATHPELFAAGAIIGGLPYASAGSVAEALQRMRGQGIAASDAEAVARVLQAPGGDPACWPTISLWHGTADATVSADNMAALGRQWRGVHGLGERAAEIKRGSNWDRTMWRDDNEHVLIEEWRISGMGHGVPIDTAAGPGVAGPYMLDVGIDSTMTMAVRWGLIDAADDFHSAAINRPAHHAGATTDPTTPMGQVVNNVQRTIEESLRAAGLMH